ncbi:TrkH family potassium uptake protein [Candidatus Bipolaricaulota bacterium]|nr:TrkH family potassium uptake protein [Candidatus Bipolaricaulota bacterium]TFH08296.1 MAG: TrkH family potassium uptake protein [Candidatus Atribacteria bacterium]
MSKLRSIFHYLGVILIAFSILQAIPLAISALYNETVQFPVRIYAIPAIISLGIGLALVLLLKPCPMTSRLSMAVGVLGWFALSILGALPYWLALDIGYLDAVYEAISGFTTTGATFLTGLALLPKSILFWRALTQWIGGLGIFTLFLFVVRESGARHSLMGAEAHKAASDRFSPGVFSSLRILWAVYGGLTLVCGLLLWAEGMTPFDAAAHALTTLSTGGYSTHDASIGYFAQAGISHPVAMEYTILAFMFLGGTSFLVFWNLLRRKWRAITGNTELRVWILLLLVAGGWLVLADRSNAATIGWHAHIRQSLFHVVSIATTTGFVIRDVSTSWFSPGTQQMLLVLMLIGGCVGSTAGGLKVFRVSVLGSVLRHRLRMILGSPLEVIPRQMGRHRLDRSEIERTVAVAVAWGIFLGIGWMLTTLVGRLDGWSSLSAIVSALGNIGPHFIESSVNADLGPVVKGIYALAMIAGRLEIVPLIILFSRKTWR